jgi:acetoin utilization deacetylase AcuC-like enzyme
MSKTGFYTDERTFWHSTGAQALFLPVGDWVQPPNSTAGVDTPDSKRRFLSLVHYSGLSSRLQLAGPVEVTREDLLRVHTQEYLRKFKEVSDAGGGEVGTVASFSKGAYEIACVSAGLAKAAVEDVYTRRVANAYALCRPAGHHCLPHQAMGFCLMANIPVALEALRAAHGPVRVAIVDWDVHHGNGTQTIYYERSDTLTISIHQDRCFPPGYSGDEDRGSGAGLGFNLNVPLPAGSGHETYLAACREIVVPALERFRPELIVVASGLDANAVDPLARMLLTSQTYCEMTRLMVECAARLCGGRLAIVHEGGYSEAYVPFCGHVIVETLSGERTEVTDPALDFFMQMQPGPRALEFQLQWVSRLATAALQAQAPGGAPSR